MELVANTSITSLGEDPLAASRLPSPLSLSLFRIDGRCLSTGIWQCGLGLASGETGNKYGAFDLLSSSLVLSHLTIPRFFLSIIFITCPQVVLLLAILHPLTPELTHLRSTSDNMSAMIVGRDLFDRRGNKKYSRRL